MNIVTEEKKKEEVSAKAIALVLLIAACLMIAGALIYDQLKDGPKTIIVEKKVLIPANETGTIDPSNATEVAIKALGGEGQIKILKQEENVTTHRRVVTQVLLKDNGTSRHEPEEREVTKDNVTYILGDKVVRMDTSQIITLVAEENSTSRKEAKP
ncbi:MAG TPA: hypothetical protein P5080_01135 [Candidatus Paceibacterota bacterium]|nr:hypothetical protein [Candidatus Paceibacterota bacterium]HSA36298.1 hypothetical protein [Candidatus Paceibacterota bacterium]